MKTLYISPQRVSYLLKNHLEIPLSYILNFQQVTFKPTKLLESAKIYLSHKNEILLSSGAKLYFDIRIKDRLQAQTPLGPVYYSGWSIQGYAADGADVDCYCNQKIMKTMIAHKRVRSAKQPNSEILDPIYTMLDDFLYGTPRNAWLETSIIKLYVRKSYRVFSADPKGSTSAMNNCFDFASIIISEKYRNRGLFTTLLNYLLSNSPYKYLYLECVYSPLIAKFTPQVSTAYKIGL